MAVAFDAVGTARSEITLVGVGAALTAAPGADVFLVVVSDRSVVLSGVAYGGTAMTQVAAYQPVAAKGIVFVYRLAGGGTGQPLNFSSTVSVPIYYTAQGFSYTGVTGVQVGVPVTGSIVSASSGLVGCESGQMILSAIATVDNSSAAVLSAPVGGTNRFLQPVVTGAKAAGLVVSDADTATSFGATLSVSSVWGAVPIILDGEPTGSVTVRPKSAVLSLTGGKPVVTGIEQIDRVVFDAVGAGFATLMNYGPVGNTASWLHTATAGADVFVDIIADRPGTIFGVKYGGHDLTLLQTVTLPLGNAGVGFLSTYRLTDAPGGQQTVQFSCNGSGGPWAAGVSTSYVGVGSVEVATPVTTSTAAASIGGSASGGELVRAVLGGIGAAAARFTVAGGTNRANLITSGGPGTAVNSFVDLAVSDATAPTTFTATDAANKIKAIAAFAQTLSPAPAAVTIKPAGVTLTLTGGTPAVTIDTPNVTEIRPVPAQLTLTGGTPNITGTDQRIIPASAVLTLTGGQPRVSNGEAGNPISGVVAKLQAKDTAGILCLGDSTVAGVGDDLNIGGWTGRLGKLLAERYDTNASIRWFAGGAGYMPTGNSTLRSGATGLAAVYDGGVSAADIGNNSGWINASPSSMSTPTTPDIIIIGEGINDLNGAGKTPSAYVTNMLAFIALIQSKAPAGTPVIVTTQNPVFTENAANTIAGRSALAVELVGAATPLDPPLRATSIPDVWMLDTQQSWGDANYTGDNTHPTAEGYDLQADWMMDQLLPAGPTVAAPQGAVLTIVGGTAQVAVSDNISVTPTGAQLALTGGQPSVEATSNTTITPTSAQLSLTSGTPIITVSDHVHVTPTGARLTIIGGLPLIETSGNITTSPHGAELALTGGTPAIAITDHITIQPAGAQLVLTGGTPWIGDPNIKANPTGAVLTIGGGQPIIIIQPLASPPPESRTIRVPARSRIIIARH